jgi:ABC-type Mn2+/Zn2+ transport system ATPase subunit
VHLTLSIPRHIGSAIDLATAAGDVVFLLGANGTGKSSLMQRFYNAHNSNARRITAHRQTWFESNAITLSPQQRWQTENNIRAHDNNPQSRWKEDFASHRASIAIYDLVDAENVRAREITSAVDGDDFDLAKELRKKDAPIKIINELLTLSNIPVVVAIQENAQVVATKNGSAPYSIAELSDGERNAILIAANVLTAKDGTLLLIDEPERHLHRSIISPLLTLLFAKRPDCTFIVSTHDVMLPLDNPNARILLIRGCAYNGSMVTAWDADVVSSASGIDDDLKRDILGARRKILFVEGAERSLDKPLYSLVFPEVSVIAKGNCREVERAVLSIREADELHWIDAFGLVDDDRRPQVDIDRLKEGGVYATPVFSVEGVYYHPEIQLRVAKRHAVTTGIDFQKCLDEACSTAIHAISPHVQRLSERVAEQMIRSEFFSQMPKKEQIAAAAPLNVTVDIPKFVDEERTRIQRALHERDLATLVSRYPVRETAALSDIARKLGFQNRDQYEGAVRKLLIDEPNALDFVRSLFGPLSDDIVAGGYRTRTTERAV